MMEFPVLLNYHPRDEIWAERILRLMQPRWQEQGVSDIFRVTTQDREDFESRIHKARLALILLSPRYVEAQQGMFASIMERAGTGELLVIPILTESTDWKILPLADRWNVLWETPLNEMNDGDPESKLEKTFGSVEQMVKIGLRLGRGLPTTHEGENDPGGSVPVKPGEIKRQAAGDGGKATTLDDAAREKGDTQRQARSGNLSEKEAHQALSPAVRAQREGAVSPKDTRGQKSEQQKEPDAEALDVPDSTSGGEGKRKGPSSFAPDRRGQSGQVNADEKAAPLAQHEVTNQREGDEPAGVNKDTRGDANQDPAAPRDIEDSLFLSSEGKNEGLSSPEVNEGEMNDGGPDLDSLFMGKGEKALFDGDHALEEERDDGSQALQGAGPVDAGVSNDAAQGEDLVGIETEVAALARTAMMEIVAPPLTIGILGGWGSGKSFVMNLMEKEMVRIRCLPALPEKDGGDGSPAGPVVKYVGHIYLVRFNAWSYAKGNLWASLMQEILTQLQDQIGTERCLKEAGVNLCDGSPVYAALYAMSKEARHRLLANAANLDFQAFSQAEREGVCAQALWQQLESFRREEIRNLENTQKEQDRLALQLKQSDERLREAAEHRDQQLNEMEARRIQREKAVVQAVAERLVQKKDEMLLKKQEALLKKKGSEAWYQCLNVVIQKSPLEADIQWFEKQREDLRAQAEKTMPSLSQFVRLLLSHPRRLAIMVLVSLVLAVGLTWGLSQIEGLVVEFWAMLGAALAPVLSYFTRARTWWAQNRAPIAEFLKEWDNLAVSDAEARAHISLAFPDPDAMGTPDQVQQEYAQKVDTLEGERLRLQARMKKIQAQLDFHRAQVGMTLNCSSLTEFLDHRLDSGGYREHLGLMHQVEQDLQELSQALVSDQGRMELFPRGKPRVVLFVDDLDRCPPDKVVEVLEATQLLVKSNLFVVVLALDVRYVTRALEKHYEKILQAHSRPNGLDYIEKIIQIPYRIRPIDAQGMRELLRQGRNLLPDKPQAEKPPQVKVQKETPKPPAAPMPHGQEDDSRRESQQEQAKTLEGVLAEHGDDIPFEFDTDAGGVLPKSFSQEIGDNEVFGHFTPIIGAMKLQLPETDEENAPAGKDGTSDRKQEGVQVRDKMARSLVAFTALELQTMTEACTGLNLTARTVKRVANVYMLLKVILFDRQISMPSRDVARALIGMLVLTAKHPATMRAAYDEILRRYRRRNKKADGDPVLRKLVHDHVSDRETRADADLVLPDKLRLQQVGFDLLHLVRAFSFISETETTEPLSHHVGGQEVPGIYPALAKGTTRAPEGP